MKCLFFKFISCVTLIMSVDFTFPEIIIAQNHKRHVIDNNLVLAKKTAVGFLKWYTANFEKFQMLQGKLISGTVGDSTKPYRINFDLTEQYLKELNKSGYLSENYFDHFRPVFKSVNEGLIKNKQWDGPIIGFEWDLIFNIIETDEITKHLNELKTVYQFQHRNEGAYIIFKLGASLHFSFLLHYHNQKWLIDELCVRYI